MTIVVRKVDGAVMMIANCPTSQYDPSAYTITVMPGWDWSLANLTGVDRTQADWVYRQTQWNGETLVRRTPPLPSRVTP